MPRRHRQGAARPSEAHDQSYVPSVSGDWTDPDPESVGKALDELATGGGTDGDAIHDNVAGEIVLVAEKGAPVSADLVIIEDSADANSKKRVQVGNLPGGGAAAAGTAMPLMLMGG